MRWSAPIGWFRQRRWERTCRWITPSSPRRKKWSATSRQQLAISEHMLAEEAKFAHAMPPDAIDEKDLLTQVDAEVSGSPAVVVTEAANSK